MVLSWEIILFIYLGLYLSEAILWRLAPKASFLLGINLPIKSVPCSTFNATTSDINHIVAQLPRHFLTVHDIADNKWQLRDGATPNVTIESGYRRYSPVLRALLKRNKSAFKLTLVVPWSLLVALVLYFYKLDFPAVQAWPIYVWIVVLLVGGISYTQIKAYISAVNNLAT
ncbi:hypothetical protein [Psychromonas sp. Urea-02u-13]|uniref:hypothetical protein n=1 Tax=Psychromonas sp. Urea-02u-13 TaxID=2058326 RepID=UPI000C339504|nr:hypothetical protein [Psychromonas sp. Urea-02u-13]PKG38293.1 hypothetical protein CXF74_14350 [Psychromonas sp. Urea-02u-13]